MNKLIMAAILAAGLFRCGDDKTEIRVPGIPIDAGVVCSDLTGKGPDITLEPPGIQHQLKGIDGCFRHGRCFYNCGKKD